MRYYGKDYLDELKRSINNVSDSAELTNYSTRIRNTYVSGKRTLYKERGIEVAQNAFNHVITVNQKLEKLQEVLESFYGEVDSVSSNAVALARMLRTMIDESNRSMVAICDMLDGVGEYKGKEVTGAAISEAGINRVNCKNLRYRFWTFMIDTEVELEDGVLDEKAVEIFLDDVTKRKIKAQDLPIMDYNRLKKLNAYYANNRFGEKNDISKMNNDTIANCVRVFEFLNPVAKEATDKFFKKSQETEFLITQLHIDAIKYSIYTMDPKLRSITLYYLSKMKIGTYENPRSHYASGSNKLYLNLTECITDGSVIFEDFFHEFGHALDDYSKLCGLSSNAFHDQLISDFKEHMDKIIKLSGYSLNEKERKELFDFVLSNKNINVKPPKGENRDYYLPKDWSSNQKDVFFYLREYYGYREYQCGAASVTYPSWSGFTDDIAGNRVIDDIIGAVTNNQFAGVFGHPLEDSEIPKSIKTTEDLMAQLEKYNYWYRGKSSDDISEALEAEFFASVFANDVRGDAHSQAEKIFGKSCKMYDDTMDKIYKDVPPKYKNFDT